MHLNPQVAAVIDGLLPLCYDTASGKLIRRHGFLLEAHTAPGPVQNITRPATMGIDFLYVYIHTGY